MIMGNYEYKTQNWSYIKNELIQIDTLLKNEIEIYLIGGSAMSYYGYKDATKDVDILFKNKYDCAEFFNAITELGYETSEQYFPPVVQMEATFFIYKDDEIWIDLFVENVMGKFELTDSIMSRSVRTKLSTKKLNINCLDRHDIFLFNQNQARNPQTSVRGMNRMVLVNKTKKFTDKLRKNYVIFLGH